VKKLLCAPAPPTVVDFGVLRTWQEDVLALGIALGSPQMIPTPPNKS
jgi:hypothetical protein